MQVSPTPGPRNNGSLGATTATCLDARTLVFLSFAPWYFLHPLVKGANGETETTGLDKAKGTVLLGACVARHR